MGFRTTNRCCGGCWWRGRPCSGAAGPAWLAPFPLSLLLLHLLHLFLLPPPNSSWLQCVVCVVGENFVPQNVGDVVTFERARGGCDDAADSAVEKETTLMESKHGWGSRAEVQVSCMLLKEMRKKLMRMSVNACVLQMCGCVGLHLCCSQATSSLKFVSAAASAFAATAATAATTTCTATTCNHRSTAGSHAANSLTLSTP